MVSFISLYLITYLLSYFGFLLKNWAKEELKELKKNILNFNIYLRYLFLLIMSFLFYKNIILVSFYLIFLIFLFFLFKIKSLSSILLDFYDIFVFSISFIVLYSYNYDCLFFILIYVFILFIKNSFSQFNIKEKIYEFVFYFLIYLFYLIFSNFKF